MNRRSFLALLASAGLPIPPFASSANGDEIPSIASDAPISDGECYILSTQSYYSAGNAGIALYDRDELLLVLPALSGRVMVMDPRGLGGLFAVSSLTNLRLEIWHADAPGNAVVKLHYAERRPESVVDLRQPDLGRGVLWLSASNQPQPDDAAGG